MNVGLARSELRGVMVGAGFFAGIQAEAWARLPSATLIAVADPLVDKAQQFAAQWGIPAVYADLDEMLRREQPDFVDIVTRPDTHVELVRPVAQCGCPILCQKPMAPTLAECEQMVQISAAEGVRLLIHENWRWQPWYREIQRLHETEQLGPIFHLGFCVRTGDGWGDGADTVQPYFREMEQLLIYETLVHHLDTARFLGGEIDRVFCQTQRVNPQIAGEDYAIVQLDFRAGGKGLIDANRIHGPVPAPKVFGTVVLEAERGAIRLDDAGRPWLTRYGEAEIEHCYDWSDQGYRGDSVFATQAYLIDCLQHGKPAESEASSYLQTVRAVEACYASATTDQVVKIASTAG